jgi:hypothetical protein
MADFVPISPEAFCAAIAEQGSAAVRREFARYDVADPATWGTIEARVHDGPLTFHAGFTAPALQTLVLGDLFVEGCVDTDDGHDHGGLFVVIGNVECDQFIGHFGKCVFIDGNLEVTQIILNAFEDSSLSVTGNLRTRFFYGWDMCGEVGGYADMEYGHGYCLPFGHSDATRQMIKPRHDVETSLRLLAIEKPGEDIGFDLVDLVRAGRSPFR